MTVQQFFKGLLMTVISVLVVAFGQVPVDYLHLAVTAVIAILAFVGANLPTLISTSEEGKFNLVDFFAALLVLIAAGLTDALALFLIEGKILWVVVGKTVASVTLTFIVSTFFGGPVNKSKKLFA